MKLIINVILKFLMFSINAVLLPINLIVENSLPEVVDAFNRVTSFLEWLKDFIAWVLSWLPLGSDFYSFMVAVIIFRFTVPLLMSGVKLVVKWWHSLAP